MNSAKAFAPGNISCIFGICKNKNPRWAGSFGLGFTINGGVVSKVSKSEKKEILFNGVKIKFPTVSDSLSMLTDENLKVDLKSKLPLGCGFGLSGACALSSLYAANKLFSLKKSNKELAIIAHTCEVINKTGLGDVVNQYYGGFLLKTVPSSQFKILRIPIKEDVYCRHFGKISTKSIISDSKRLNSINSSAEYSINKIKSIIKERKMSFEEAADISCEFAKRSNLLSDKRTKKMIERIKKSKGHASMIMLGKSVFSDVYFKGSEKFKISKKGAHVISK